MGDRKLEGFPGFLRCYTATRPSFGRNTENRAIYTLENVPKFADVKPA
jgi:hypothetical protein